MKFGLIGKSLSHSFSKTYFSQKFREENIPAEYFNFEISDISAFKNLLSAEPDLLGLNVTIPWKKEIIPFLDELDPVAAAVGAVNVIRIRDGKTSGYNTDVPGFRDSLAEFYEDPDDVPALILGTGGSAKAVAYVLAHHFDFDPVHFASRNPDSPSEISYSDLKKSGIRNYRLIVNCTPVGMFPDTDAKPDLPLESLSKDQYLFDLIYNPEWTIFLSEGKKQGCKVSGGMDMLIRQAEYSWEIWNRD